MFTVPGWGHDTVPVQSDSVYEYFHVVFAGDAHIHDTRLFVGGTIQTAKELLDMSKVSQLWGIRAEQAYLLA